MSALRAMLITGMICFATPAFAQSAGNTPPPPCTDEAYHQFDFWLGEWEVSGPNGNLAGHNTIERAENGCLITESWVNTAGGTGQSLNFYNPDTGLWRQVWVSAGSIIDYTGGLTETGSMKLEGTITYHGNGTSFPFTGEWTPNEDGSVTPHFEQYNLDTKDWAVWFTGRYVRTENE